MDRKEIKATARMRMAQSDPGYVKIMLLYVLTAVVLPQVALAFVSRPVEVMDQLSELIYSGIDIDVALRVLQISSQQIISEFVLNIVLWIYQLILAFGLTRYCLSLYRGEPGGPADLFSGFSIAGRVLGAQLLVSLIIIACTLGLVVVFGFAVGLMSYSMDEASLIGLLIVFWLVFFAFLIVILLSYALMNLSLADQPELGAMGAIQYGKNLIRGHKGQYFVLMLSFFGWALLCGLPQSILVTVESYSNLALPDWMSRLLSVAVSLPVYLWFTPYMNTAAAGFYDALHRERLQAPPVGPGTF